MDLKTLNAVSLLEKRTNQRKLGELERDKPYKILDGSIVKSKFGAVVLLELEDFVVFLPARVTETYKPFVQFFKEQKYYLVYKGTKDTKKPNPAYIFEVIEKN